MRATRPAFALAALALALPAAAVVHVDWDGKAPFATYKTFAWHDGTPAKNELVQQRVVNAVNDALAAEGLKASSDAADLWVVTHATSEMKEELRVTDYGYAYGPSYYAYGGAYRGMSIDTYEYRMGTLVVDLVDSKTGKLVWRGEAQDSITSDPQKIEKKIRKVVTKMFAEYPPPAR